eukprot:gene11164-biopygen5596
MNLSGNVLSGTIPSGFGEYFQTLDVSYNLLTGNIPEDVFQYQYWEGLIISVLDFSYNLLSGDLPSGAALSRIYTFFAQSNCLEGSLDRFFSENTAMHFLQAVDVSSNQLTGRLPDYLSSSQLRGITSFAAVQNCFTGTIPESFCNLTTLRALALDGLSTAKACRSPILSSVLPQVHSYSLSRGAIHGSIPKCLFGMPLLRTLHLSGNGLGGSIPVKEESDLGPYLSDLSLSHNGLSGSLPGPLRGGSRWASVYLNINRLSGHIPGFYYEIGEGSSGSGGEVDMLRVWLWVG